MTTATPETITDQTADQQTDALPYVLVRTENAGVFVGQLEEYDRATRTATVRNARRIWYWDGAASLSELATRGTSKPARCKFPAAVESSILPQVIEVDSVTDEAKASIDAVPVWTA